MEVEYVEVKDNLYIFHSALCFRLIEPYDANKFPLPPPHPQPTVHFAEEPIIRVGDEYEEEDGERSEEEDEEEEERPAFPMEKQRLIRKDTPHYKKHFKITKLPKPEAVAALLQGFSPDGLGSPTQAPPQDELDDGEEDEESSLCKADDYLDGRLQVNSSQAKVSGRRETCWTREKSA